MGTGNGWTSKSLLPVAFGLGETASVDWVEVFWPPGARNAVLAPAPGQALRVVENPNAPVLPPGPGTVFRLGLRGPALV
jgi:hypothetical protein